MLTIHKQPGTAVLYVGWPPRHDLRFVVDRRRDGVGFSILWSDAERGLYLSLPWPRRR